jgi:hypothetical protein
MHNAYCRIRVTSSRTMSPPRRTICCAAQHAALPKAVGAPVLVSTYYLPNKTTYVISGVVTVNHWGFTLFKVRSGVARLIRRSSRRPSGGCRRLRVQSLRCIRARFGAGHKPAPLAVFCVAVCLLVAGCSPGAEFPSIFPAVHDMPPPRTETPMNQTELQKATEDLISQRDHLNAEAPKPAATPAAQTASASTKPPAKKAAHKASQLAAAAASPATTASAQGAGTQAAGTDPKP